MKLQTLIVDDSAFMRLLLSDVLSSDPGLNIMGTAKDGLEAVQVTLKHRPDVIVMDMEMGEYNGLYAIKHIMEQCPTPILILSSVGNTNLEPIFDALRLGAVDYMNKPVRGGSKIRTMDQELISRLKGIYKAKPQIVKNNQARKAPSKKKKSTERFEILIIGASTGGPSAVEQVIIGMQDQVEVPVVICQHMPPNFIDPFIRRINSRTPLNVVLGEPGMEPRKGNVIICPGDANLEFKRRGKSGAVQLVSSDKTFKEYNNPSINAIMLSAADVYGASSLGVILTGMGKDGAKGMNAIGSAGGMTVAQDETSSVIFGMPKAAVETGKVDQVLDVKEIGAYLISVT